MNRRSYKGKNNPFYNKKHTETTKRLISKVRKERRIAKGKNNGMYGKTHTKEVKDKIRHAQLGRKHNKETIKKRTKTRKLRYSPKEKIYTREGYVCLYKPKHPNANKNGRIFEHRFLVSDYLNRQLLSFEQVHHKDLDKTNNKINNLVLFENSKQHNKFHLLTYQYILDKYGIEEINNYITWFKNKFKNSKNIYYFEEK